MNWTELTPISPTNLNSLESRISAAIAEAATGKTNLYNAIVAKGITPSSTSFADLVTAIGNIIKATGNATAAQVLADIIFSNASANGQVGTMPNRAGDTAALALSISGTTLKLRASNGYRDGVDDNVTHTDANRIAANIRKNTVLDGITGAYTGFDTVTAGPCYIALKETYVETQNPTTYTLNRGGWTVNYSGTIRIRFSFNATYNSIGYAKIYKNGVAVGTERNTDSNANTMTATEDFSCTAGDVFSIYVRNGSTGNTGTASIYFGIVMPTAVVTAGT